MKSLFVDVNECLFVNGGCDDICVNTPGSFQCQCQTGQSLNANGRCSGRYYIQMLKANLFSLPDILKVSTFMSAIYITVN